MSSTIRFGDLPADMQQLLSDIVDRWDLDDWRLTVRRVPLAAFPDLPWLRESRAYCQRETEPYMAGVRNGTTPPVALVGNRFVDGCHRLTAARRAGLAGLDAIDLAEIGIDPLCVADQDIIGLMRSTAVAKPEDEG